MIYLDYASNYPTKKEVLNYFNFIETNYIGNFNSTHPLGIISKGLYNDLNKDIKDILNLDDNHEIIYTSSATESNNLAIKGIVKSYSGFGKKILVSEEEHSSINGALGSLKDQGYIIEQYKTLDNGEFDFNDLKNKLSDDVILVIGILVEDETGFIHDYKKLNDIVKGSKNAHLLIDATQAIGKFKIDLNELDLVSFTPHKFGGIIGSGCLIKKKDTILYPLINGGSSASIYRSGSVPLGIIGTIYKSLELAYKDLDINYKIVKDLNEYFINELNKIDGVLINSFTNPYIINISIPSIPSYKSIEYFNNKEICISQKAACSIKNTPSKIIFAIYKDKKRAASSLRISISELTLIDEIDEFIKCLKELIN